MDRRIQFEKMDKNYKRYKNIQTRRTDLAQCPKERRERLNWKSWLRTMGSVTAVVAHVLIGIIVSMSLLYAFRSGMPLSYTSQHIILCVIGYQFLMAEAILCLASDSWMSSLNLKQRRLVHWLLQILGSSLALTGGIIKSSHKETNWNTLHGQFGLVAMVFTTASLFNGIASLYAYELRHIIPGHFSKLSHVCFGIVAFSAACTCLCCGFDKHGFRNWANTYVTDMLIIFTGALAVMVILNPVITFYTKLSNVLKK